MSRRFLIVPFAVLFLLGTAFSSDEGGHGEKKAGGAKRRIMKESPTVGTYWVEEESGAALPREEALKTLPCFQCHSIESFINEPEKGKFPHARHAGFGVHCNQCHQVSGHSRPTVERGSCNACHALKKIAYQGGGMGSVQYNHEFHAQAFKCADCHLGLFNMKKGSTKMLMDAMYGGRLCGACHDGKTAFASQDCIKCHKG